jgi:putative endonuclease
MFLYLLENTISSKLYLGITKDLNRRLREHNSPQNHFTGKTLGTWKLAYSKWFDSELEARKEEIRLKKSKNKKYIEWYFSKSRAIPT